ncbi:MAG: hypothetical protein ACUVSU_13785 [Aggregatilineaceae bacterium]
MPWIEFGPQGQQSTAPEFCLQTSGGEMVTRGQFRHRQHLVLCFVPRTLSAADHEQVQRLRDAQDDIAEASARLYLLARHASALSPGLPLLLDPDDAVRQRYAALFSPGEVPSADEPFTVILDRYGAPAHITTGWPEVGEVLVRLWGLQYECPE